MTRSLVATVSFFSQALTLVQYKRGLSSRFWCQQASERAQAKNLVKLWKEYGRDNVADHV